MDFIKMADDVIRRTGELVDKYGPRRSGSQACISCADEIHDEMKKFSDKTMSQKFKVNTGAFMGWIRIVVFLYTSGTVFLWLGMPFVSGLLLLIGILVLVFQFFFYKHMIDFLFRPREGRNITGIIEPEGEVKRQFIISGHHDSASIFNFLIHQPKLYGLRVIGSIGSLLGVCLLSFITSIVGNPQILTLVLAIIASICAIIVLQLWFFASSEATPGAGDNLAASVAAMEVLRRFRKDRDEGKGLLNTRIIAVSFDGEEEGLRGAYAFTRQNKELLESVDTYMFNLECLYDKDSMYFLTSDINCSVNLSEEFAGKCSEASGDMGLDIHAKPLAFLTGGTDAGELAKTGVQATTLMAMPWDNSERASVYHTPSDTIDAVDKEAVAAAMEIFYRVVRNSD